MGIVELTKDELCIIRSQIITYGSAADTTITERIRLEIESMWNAPQSFIIIKKIKYFLIFQISAFYEPNLKPDIVINNRDPQKNFFRIEPKASGNISFVDGLGSNSGYFQLDNLYDGSTTAAHEYGHTLGLPHPTAIDYRGQGEPGIMYPRGTLVDQQFQYNPIANLGEPGFTMHPKNRVVRPADIHSLRLNEFNYSSQKSIIGSFTNIWHEAHDIGYDN